VYNTSNVHSRYTYHVPCTRHPFNDTANKPSRSEPNSASRPSRRTPLDGIPDTQWTKGGKVRMVYKRVLSTALACNRTAIPLPSSPLSNHYMDRPTSPPLTLVLRTFLPQGMWRRVVWNMDRSSWEELAAFTYAKQHSIQQDLQRCVARFLARRPLPASKNNHWTLHPCSREWRTSGWQLSRIQNV
jgi:hypothetical protein